MLGKNKPERGKGCAWFSKDSPDLGTDWLRWEGSWKSPRWRVAVPVGPGAGSPNRGPEVEAGVRMRVQRWFSGLIQVERCGHKLEMSGRGHAVDRGSRR